MPRILKNNAKKIAIIFILIIFESLMLCWQRKLLVLVAALIIDLILIGIMLNKYITKKYILGQLQDLNSRSHVRNVDYIIIGEPVRICDLNLNPDKTFIQVSIPGIYEGGVYQILRKIHSILKNEGEVIIALKEKHLNDFRIRPIETLYMLDLTIKQIGLKKTSKLAKFVLFIQPIDCFKLLMNVKVKGFKEINRPDSIITNFCEERDYSIKYYVR